MPHRPQRILAVVTDAFGAAGGMAKFNRDLLRGLAAEHTVTALPLLCKPQDGATEQPPAQLRYLTQVARWRYFAAQRMGPAVVWAAAKHGPFDVIVCGHLYLLPVCRLAQRLCPGAQLVQVVHGIEAWEPTARPQVNRLTPHIDALWSVSAITAERFAAWALPHAGRTAGSIPITVLPNCIDAQAFGPGPKDPQLLRHLGLQGRTVLLTLGRMAAAERYKGVDTLLDLMPQIRARHPQAAYLVVGDGDDRARLQAKAQRMGLQSHVRFTGSIPEASKAAHYRLADCFVMPGRGEGFGIVYLEALACGVPVVASRADGSFEAVREGRLGEVADPEDPSSILTAIDAALQRPRGVPAGLEHFHRDAFDHRLRDAVSALNG